MKARSGREAFALIAVYVCCVVVLLAVFGVVDMNEQSYIDQIDPPAYAGTEPVTSPAREPVPTPPPTVQSEEGAASSDAVLVPVSLAAPLEVADVVSAPLAERGTQIPGPTLPPPGLNGLPFAPADLTGCDEMEWYRVQAGLIDHFDGVGFRESSCRNTVSSSCCHGYWQIHEGVWIPMPECSVATVAALLGTDPIDKQRNACAARVVYETQGGSAWDAW